MPMLGASIVGVTVAYSNTHKLIQQITDNNEKSRFRMSSFVVRKDCLFKTQL